MVTGEQDAVTLKAYVSHEQVELQPPRGTAGNHLFREVG